MALGRSAWASLVVGIALTSFLGAALAMASPIGEIGDADCGWAWQAIRRSDTPVCDAPGWRRLGLAVALAFVGLISLVIAAKRRRSTAVH